MLRKPPTAFLFPLFSELSVWFSSWRSDTHNDSIRLHGNINLARILGMGKYAYMGTDANRLAELCSQLNHSRLRMKVVVMTAIGLKSLLITPPRVVYGRIGPHHHLAGFEWLDPAQETGWDVHFIDWFGCRVCPRLVCPRKYAPHLSLLVGENPPSVSIGRDGSRLGWDGTSRCG
ncbi:hypothetical protein SUGI_1519210 [Cryptomeria japonica]|uniref:Uncharacterized protein n=1 Tax=Cryptomeria japonica TaxID=3369 RepID=A0AAD3RQH4_CRYJA|nr:hypothetical protein SUGI_1518650 [Cryptomeria japonica]GLJ59683.1 hypothetical protein SUGI_1518920 [Cryptomeria japonica]GLJ59692.1 hypothetical protein SUGI_1519210 [Cryptomeria japonica]